LQHADQILVQTSEDGARYRAAGAPDDRIRVNGNLKFDVDPRVAAIPPNVAAWFEAEQGPTWIAASTMPPAREGDCDEDDIVIHIYGRLRSQIAGLRLILAPRKPERFDVVARKLSGAGLEYVRRSNGRGNAAVLLLDSIGELSSLFALADVVFVGGSLADRGGHNLLEPAFFGVPIVVGPHLENFAGIADAFASRSAMVQVPSAARLEAALTDLLRNEEKRRVLGARAREAADSERGATDRTLLALNQLQAESVPRALPYGPLRVLGHLLSALWQQGGRLKRSRDLKRQKALPAPVISVGGIAMGGSGKTPFVACLAGMLKEQGYRVAILTRGYGRRSPEKQLILKAGSAASARVTGDEAQIFLRDGNADIGIGADRWQTGMELYRQFQPDLYLLDDGFQHARLKRDLDIVMLDGLDPFGGEALFPVGRLREPLAALSRADLVVVSRAEGGRNTHAIEVRVRRANSAAPIMRTETNPLFWIDLNDGGKTEPDSVRDKRVAAFCGLANPASFWRTLTTLGCQPVARWSFGDHHHYSAAELNRMAAAAQEHGADLLLTTEKDAANLPLETANLVVPLKLVWLKIAVRLCEPGRLIELIKSKVVYR
jgi:tetraacyldisaccharide 4'-kinase